MPTIKVSTFENAIATSVKVYNVSAEQVVKVQKFFDKLNTKHQSMQTLNKAEKVQVSDTTMLPNEQMPVK